MKWQKMQKNNKVSAIATKVTVDDLYNQIQEKISGDSNGKTK